MAKKQEMSGSDRNVVLFTGRALVEILRDQTMQKSFMTLAYISDMMVGSEISPIQKQKLLKIAKSYIGEGEQRPSWQRPRTNSWPTRPT